MVFSLLLKAEVTPTDFQTFIGQNRTESGVGVIHGHLRVGGISPPI